MAAYAAAAGIAAKVFMPKDVKVPFIRECELYGAEVTLVDGLITDAGRDRRRDRAGRSAGTTCRPSRSRTGSKARRRWATSSPSSSAGRYPDWIIYPTGGGTGMVGMWKAFEEMERIGWMQRGTAAAGWSRCRPSTARRSSRAFEQGAERSEMWQGARTVADGLRVPKAVGDFLVLRAVRESGGTALAVSDADMVAGMRELGRREGISAAPEGGAALARAEAAARRTASSKPPRPWCSSTPAAR